MPDDDTASEDPQTPAEQTPPSEPEPEWPDVTLVETRTESAALDIFRSK